jgi:hypothetical protein
MISMLPIVSHIFDSGEPSAVVKGILHNTLYFFGTILSSRTTAANANSVRIQSALLHTRQEFY